MAAEPQIKLEISRQTRKCAKKAYCHFDRREKSFLDPSHSLGMTGLARHLAFLASWRDKFSCYSRVGHHVW